MSNTKHSQCSLEVTVNSKRVTMLIDSGSNITILHIKAAKRLNLPFKKPPSIHPQILGANNIPIMIVGIIPNACIETLQGFLVDNVWIASNLLLEAIFGQSSLTAFQALTIQYGGSLPTLKVHQISTAASSGFTRHSPVQCFSQVDKNITAIRAPSRCRSTADKQFIRDEIQRLLVDGKIRASQSSWRSQVFVCREPGRKPCMVVDYTQTVNKITPLDAYPIPLVADLLDEVSKYKVFSYIDLKDAFHQFRLDPNEWHFTAFKADGQLWEFTCIPFGLRNSPAAFNRALHDILGELPGVITYTDDVVVGGRDQEKHDSNLRKLVQRATKAHLKFSPSKCVFRGTSLWFLGHVIKNGSISPDPQRAAPFLNFPVPSSFSELQRFVGLAVYHSKWIPLFSKLMDPVFSALNARTLPLSREALQAIQQIKQSIKQAILHVVDPNRPLTLVTDASKCAIGAILSQDSQPVAFMSKRLSNSQKLWSPAELEGLAVVEACNQFHHYLSGRHFTILCDQCGFVQVFEFCLHKRG